MTGPEEREQQEGHALPNARSVYFDAKEYVDKPLLLLKILNIYIFYCVPLYKLYAPLTF